MGPLLLAAALLASPDLTYEDARVARVLGVERLTPDPAPEGKRIAWVRVVQEDVFVEDEWIPTFFNLFHWLTDEDVIAREVLLAPGEPYTPERAEETSRILREMDIFSLVRVVPVRVAAPDEVGVVVYTRDLWTLRLEQSFQLTGGTLDEATVQLTERNLFGRANRATVRVSIAPLSYSVGEVYLDPRLMASDLALTQSFDVIFSRETGDGEGARGSLRLERPLRNLAQRWGWGVGGEFDFRVARQIQDGEVLRYDDPGTAEVEAIRRVWDQRFVTASASGTYQVGDDFKHQFQLGGGFGRLEVEANDETGLPPESAAAFRRDVLPRERTSVYPFAGVSGFEPRWKTYRDLATFGQSEDVRLGAFWGTSVSVPLEALGSTEDAVVVGARLGYVGAFAGDGLAEVAAAGETRLEGRDRLDEVLYLRARGATPTLGLGRLVLRGDYTGRRDDSASTLVSLGGDNGLRGYESQAFFGFGVDLLRAGLEYRTAPWVWSFVHVGGVLFYDGGSVFERLEDVAWHHSAGLGLRALVPQFNRVSYRVDVGFPLDAGGFQVLISAGSGQAVPTTRYEDALYQSNIGGLPVQP